MAWNDLSGATAIVRPDNQGNVPDGTENQGAANNPLIGNPWVSDPAEGNGYQFFIDFGAPAQFDSISVSVLVPAHTSKVVRVTVSGCESLGGSFGAYGHTTFPNATSPWGGGTWTGTAVNDGDDPATVAAQISVGPFNEIQTLTSVYDHFTNQTYSCLTANSAEQWVLIDVGATVGEAVTVGSIQVGTGMVPTGSGGPGTQPDTAPAATSTIGGNFGPVLAGGLSAAWVGIISYNNAFYVVQQTHGGQVFIAKTSDLTAGYGATWAAVGGDCPITATPPYTGGTPWFDGDHTITVAAIAAAGYVALCDFDLSTETWGTAYGWIDALGMLAVLSLYRRPDGSFLLIGEQNGSNVLPAAVYASGAWGAPFEIAANMLALSGCPSNPTTNQPKSCMDASGNVYVFWQLEGYTVLPDSTSAGPQSAWYGRAFYQRVATDNSLPSSAGSFYDFPGQDTAVSTGATFPAAKDGDLAWNTTKRNLTGGHTFTGEGGDCFGKPCIVGTSIFVPIRRKIPGTLPFVDPTTDEQLYTYATFYEGDGLPAPIWTELATGCDPAPPATSTNKCDAVGNAVSITNFLLVLYLYSNLGTTDHTDDNTAAQTCVQFCYCTVTGGVPDFNWMAVTLYDRDAAVAAFPDANLYKLVFDAILSMVGTAPVVMADFSGGACTV